MNIASVIPINFELVTLEDGSIYFREPEGKWFQNLIDGLEINFNKSLESAYQAYKAEHPELP